MRLQAEIERRVHAARPGMRWADGGQLLDDMMSRIAKDRLQRATTEEANRASRSQKCPEDPESLKALLFLLKCLDAVDVRERKVI